MTYAEQLGLTREEAEAVAAIGAQLLGNGSLEEARDIFEGLTTLNPLHGGMWAALGSVYVASKMEPEAEAAFRKGLEVTPGLPHALAGLGELLVGRGDGAGSALLKQALAAPGFASSRAGARAADALRTSMS